MSVRKSKRLASTDNAVPVAENICTLTCSRRVKSKREFDTKSEKSKLIQGKSISTTKNETQFATNDRRSSRNITKSTKSNYFESAESEESDSEVEIQKSACKRKSTASINDSNSKKKSAYKSGDCDSSDDFVKRQSNISLLEKATQSCVKTFESESDSSSDDDTKSVYKIENERPSLLVDSLESDNEATVDYKQAEFFDFTTLVSQMTQATQKRPEIEQTVNKESKENPTTSSEKKLKSNPVIQYKKVNVKTEQMEVCELLAMGEKTDMSATDIKTSVLKAQEEYEIPKQVEVLLDTPLVKKKKCNDLETALRRRLNNIRRENQVYIHKVHILCLIAHGTHLNRILNSPEVLASALSLLPSEKCYPPKRMNMEYLEDLMKWFGKKVELKRDLTDDERIDLVLSLQNQFGKKEAGTKLDLCFMFICVIRALGIKCRLIINLNVVPIKPTSDQLLPITQKKEEEQVSKTGTCEKVKLINTEKKSDKCSRKSVVKEKKHDKVKLQNEKSNTKKNSSTDGRKVSEKETRRSSRLTNSKSKYFGDERSVEKSRIKCKIHSTKQNPRAKDPLVEEMSSSDSDDSEKEFVKPKKKKIDRRVISSDEEAESSKKESDAKPSKPANKTNYWLEVYLEAEEKWVSVDVLKKSYLCDEELYKSTTHPVRYILAWNNDQTIKDVTKRYVPQFLTVTRKLRTDEDWWTDTMESFKPLSTPQEREEDEELDKKLEEMPLPQSISEYKNHPLYALKRHLLKYQAIYPADAPPLGFVKDEPVYSRLCVHQLHGREMWIKEAKVVKLGEQPYKIVKGRQKKDKFGTGEGPRDLELFGIWQVEDYIPPTAENGKVPRNAFGNVELFKMSMLPKGTVYLQIPGLQKIANKLNIDCAAAITGFDYSTNGWSYPVKDGYVVCEEFKDILLDAFNQEVEEAEKKEKQKREERIYGNWKRLIRGLFIAEKLKRRYNFGEPSTSKKDLEDTSERAK